MLGQATLVLHLDGSARGGVLLSPLLLLLHPHPPLARLHHANRYAPCMACSAVALGAAALLEACSLVIPPPATALVTAPARRGGRRAARGAPTPTPTLLAPGLTLTLTRNPHPTPRRP